MIRSVGSGLGAITTAFSRSRCSPGQSRTHEQHDVGEQAWRAILNRAAVPTSFSYVLLYGLSVTRILIGLTGVGLLLTNFSSRLLAFGSGSAWNGEGAGARQRLPRRSGSSAGSTASPTTTCCSRRCTSCCSPWPGHVCVLGWRFKIVLPIYFVLWVSFIEMNDALGAIRGPC